MHSKVRLLRGPCIRVEVIRKSLRIRRADTRHVIPTRRRMQRGWASARGTGVGVSRKRRAIGPEGNHIRSRGKRSDCALIGGKADDGADKIRGRLAS